MFTPEIIAKLTMTLDVSRISHRAIPGKEKAAERTSYAKNPELYLSYLETHDVIRIANELFGFDGWCCRTISNEMAFLPLTIDRAGTNDDGSPWKTTNYEVGFKCIVEIQVNGCIRQGTGFGAGKMKNLPDACDLACKAAESDAIKRAFKSFGNQFGLELYDKQFIAELAAETKAPKPAAVAEAVAPKGPKPATIASIGRMKPIEVPMTEDGHDADWLAYAKRMADGVDWAKQPALIAALFNVNTAGLSNLKEQNPGAYKALTDHAATYSKPEPTMGA